jgi:predicted ATPase
MATSQLTDHPTSTVVEHDLPKNVTCHISFVRTFLQCMNEQAGKKIHFVHGDEGTGKSRLLRFLRTYCCKQFEPADWQNIKNLGDAEFIARVQAAPESKNIHSALLDFGVPIRRHSQPQDVFYGLLALRRSLSAYGLAFPLFDSACIWYLHRTGKFDKSLIDELFPDRVSALAFDILADWSAEKGVSWGARLERLWRQIVAGTRSDYKVYEGRFKKYASDLEKYKGTDPESSLMVNLPRFFATDINEAMKQDTEKRLVLLFDTHNAFWTATEQGTFVGNLLKEGTLLGNLFHIRDEWLRRLLRELAGVEGVITVVADNLISRWEKAGQAQIKQEELDTYKVEYWQQTEADQYLQRAGIDDVERRNWLLLGIQREGGQVLPLDLALSVDLIKVVTGRGLDVTSDTFADVTTEPEGHTNALSLLLLQYLPLNFRTAFLTLSACRVFDRDVFEKLGKEYSFEPTDELFNAVIQYLFVSKMEIEGKSYYSIHNGVRNAFYDHDAELMQRVHMTLEQYYTRATQAGEVDAELSAIYHANRVNGTDGARKWLRGFEEGLSKNDFQRCRRLLEVCRELDVESDALTRGRVSQLKGDYYRSVKLPDEAREEYIEASDLYDTIKTDDDGEFLRNKKLALLGAMRLKPLKLHKWKLDPLDFTPPKYSYANGRLKEEKPPENTLEATRLQEKLARARNLPELDQFVEQICNLQGSYLITGHRGIGKTSAISYALYKAATKMKEARPQSSPTLLLPVMLNIARNYEENNVEKLLMRIIQRLYGTLHESQFINALKPELRKQLMRAYLKTTAKVTESQKEGQTTTFGISETITRTFQAELSGEASGETGPVNFLAKTAAKLGGKLGYSRSKAETHSLTSQQAKELAFALEYLAYDREIAESELVKLIHDLSEAKLNVEQDAPPPPRLSAFRQLLKWMSGPDEVQEPPVRAHKLHLVFIFDEMDKLDLATIKQLTPMLKELLLTSKATFIFIGAESVASNWLMRDDPEGDISFGIFASMFYVPLFREEEFRSMATALLKDSSAAFPDDLLDHLILHCYGTPREFFRQLLKFVGWDNQSPILHVPPNLIPPKTFERLYALVKKVNSEIKEGLPNEIKDHLKRSVDKWLIVAERAGPGGFNIGMLSDSVLVKTPAADGAKATFTLGGYWEQVTTAHLETFFRIMKDAGVFTRIPELPHEERYQFNQDFTLGLLWHMGGAMPFDMQRAAEEGKAPANEGALAQKPLAQTAVTTGVQAGTAVQAVGVPPDIPARTSNFVGRAREMDAAQQVVERSAFVQIVGMPGIGKTALATVIAHNLSGKYTDGVIWIDVTNEMTDVELLRRIIEKFGARPVGDTPEKLEVELRSAVGNKISLLVINDADALVDSTPTGLNRVTTIITSRQRSDKLKSVGSTYQLLELSDEDALALLSQASGQPVTEADAAAEVCKLVGKHPLAIKIVGGFASRKHLSMAALAQKLRETEIQLSLLRVVEPGLGKGSLMVSLDKSYGSLNETEQRIFRAAGVYATAFTSDAIAALLEEGERTLVAAGLDKLVDRSLLMQAEGGYAMHALLRAYASFRAREKGELDLFKNKHTQYFYQSVVLKRSSSEGRAE